MPMEKVYHEKGAEISRFGRTPMMEDRTLQAPGAATAQNRNWIGTLLIGVVDELVQKSSISSATAKYWPTCDEASVNTNVQFEPIRTATGMAADGD